MSPIGNCTSRTRVCLPGENASRDRCRPNVLRHPTVRLSAGDWPSTLFNVWVAQILLMEQLQIPVEVIEYGPDASHAYYRPGPVRLSSRSYNWDALERANGDPSCADFNSTSGLASLDEECTHAFLEIWSGQSDQRVEYVFKRNAVVDGGSLGTVGQLGWYTHNDALRAAPQFASFRGMQDGGATSAYFRRAQRLGEYCSASPTSSPAANARASVPPSPPLTGPI